MRFHFQISLSLLATFIFFATMILAAPIADAEADPSPKAVPYGTSHFARSIPELIAEKKAKEQRAALAAKEKRREMGLW